MNKLQEEIATTKKMIKYVEGYTFTDKCKGYAPGCPNCESQLLIGHLENYLDLLEWDLKENY